ncbi:solute carrier family 51 subunit beta [Boleophthalmus pectinirostris]|uniref:solute carrier family 51 subunit beta n=1 Tax=Boleophthalmus pectinirostris TaxID=150288 RepID=UPI00242E0500|nr:solute carrier family 51 subunit beta [Boleophthalmus pectinirostris]
MGRQPPPSNFYIPTRAGVTYSTMSPKWCALFLLLSGTQAFLIHNVRRSLCLDEVVESGEVVARKCSLDSASQQWIWEERTRLVNMATSRCLSAYSDQPLRTEPCPEPGERALELEWECDSGRLMSRSSSLWLSLKDQRLVLTDSSKNIQWRSLDKGDICQETLRSRRASEEFEVAPKPTLSSEEREYLRWFYRTEDAQYWKFSVLALAFVCLLIGFMLLGMGAMANKNRKKIAKYKAAAALLQKKDCEELRVISLEDTSAPSTPLAKPPASSSPPNGELSDCKPGNIVLTYKDGNTSSLYPDTTAATAEEVSLTGEDRQAEAVEEEAALEITTAQPDTQEEEEEKVVTECND